MSDGDFHLTRDGVVATITLDRPQKRNALTPASLAQLERLAGEFRDDAETRVVLIRAEGADFSVGADLSSVGGGAAPPTIAVLRRSAGLGARLMRALREIHQPTICVLQGVATGAGACIASACDFRVAAEDTRVGYGEVKLGIPLMWNALPLAVQLVGPSRAKQMVMTGALIEAARLAEWGFVDIVVPAGRQHEAALEMAATYAALPPIAVQMIKRSVNALAGALDAAVMHADSDQWLLATRTGDFREAVDAFRAKRAGVYRGD